MRNLIDIRTLIFVLTIVALCRALILGYVWTITRQYPPVKLWMMGSAMVATGALLLGLRGTVPDMVSVLLAQSFLLTGWMTISFGSLTAAEHPVPWRAGVVILFGAIAGCFWFLVVTPNFSLRTVVTSVPPIIFDIYVAVACLSYRGNYRKTTLRVLASLLLVSAAANCLKTYEVYITDARELFIAGWAILQFYVVALISSVVGTVMYVLLAVHHVQEQLDLELVQHKKHDESLKIAAMFFENTSEGMIITDADGTITSVNPAFTALSGFSADEAIGKTPRILKSNKQDAAFYKRLWDDLISKGEWKGEMWNRDKSGNLVSEQVAINTVFGPDGSVKRRIAIYHDITQQKKSSEAIFHQANYDALTGLANRHLFFQQFAKELSQARRAGNRVGLLFMDLNRFKPVNDQFGHEAGDFVLRTVANRWRKCVRAGDMLARMGGDEFALIICNLSLATDAIQISQKLISATGEPVELPNGSRCDIGLSIGISIYPNNAGEMDSLVAAADAAMYESKQSGQSMATLSQAESRPRSIGGNWLVFETAHLTGVKIIDEQHRQMVQAVNDLNRIIGEGGDDAELQKLLSELLAFTSAHFATEEMLMAKYDYPGVEEHQKQHVGLLSDLQAIAGQFNPGVELEILQSIKDWLMGHIQQADKPLGAYLTSRDVSLSQ
jgi:diguanylate cyclase (GGDEF)-like protein/hemerythrin-like metal-binding protein/PAS domain S-box-containing protein